MLFNSLKKLLGGSGAGSEPSASRAPEHAVIVEFDYGQTDLTPLFKVEDELVAAIAGANAGEFDGNEMAVDGSNGRLYMYGPDANVLFAAVKPILSTAACLRNVRVTLRFGEASDPSAREETVTLGEN